MTILHLRHSLCRFFLLKIFLISLVPGPFPISPHKCRHSRAGKPRVHVRLWFAFDAGDICLALFVPVVCRVFVLLVERGQDGGDNLRVAAVFSQQVHRNWVNFVVITWALLADQVRDLT